LEKFFGKGDLHRFKERGEGGWGGLKKKTRTIQGEKSVSTKEGAKRRKKNLHLKDGSRRRDICHHKKGRGGSFISHGKKGSHYEWELLSSKSQERGQLGRGERILREGAIIYEWLQSQEERLILENGRLFYRGEILNIKEGMGKSISP